MMMIMIMMLRRHSLTRIQAHSDYFAITFSMLLQTYTYIYIYIHISTSGCMYVCVILVRRTVAAEADIFEVEINYTIPVVVVRERGWAAASRQQKKNETTTNFHNERTQQQQ